MGVWVCVCVFELLELLELQRATERERERERERTHAAHASNLKYIVAEFQMRVCAFVKCMESF